jgi:hypothetical protein
MIFPVIDFIQVIADIVAAILNFLNPIVSPLGLFMVTWMDYVLPFFPRDNLTPYIVIAIVIVVIGLFVNITWPGDKKPRFLAKAKEIDEKSEKKAIKVDRKLEEKAEDVEGKINKKSKKVKKKTEKIEEKAEELEEKTEEIEEGKIQQLDEAVKNLEKEAEESEEEAGKLEEKADDA